MRRNFPDTSTLSPIPQLRLANHIEWGSISYRTTRNVLPRGYAVAEGAGEWEGKTIWSVELVFPDILGNTEDLHTSDWFLGNFPAYIVNDLLVKDYPTFIIGNLPNKDLPALTINDRSIIHI
jgi:hypothetical protein